MLRYLDHLHSNIEHRHDELSSNNRPSRNDHKSPNIQRYIVELDFAMHYTVNSEFGSFEFGITPTITLTNCVFVSSQFPPQAADTIVSPAMTNFPSFGFPTTLFP